MAIFSKSSIKFWVGIAVGAFFLFLALRGQNFNDIGKALASANYWWILPALVAYFIGVAVRAVRWHYLLSPLQKVSAARLFPVVVIGYMANNVLPIRMGEVVRAYVLHKREGVRKTASLATIVVERIMDGLTMLLFLSVASLFVRTNSEIDAILRVGALVFLAIIVIFLVVAHNRTLMKKLEAFGLRFVPVKLRPKVEGLGDAFIDGLQVLRSWRDLLSVFGLSLVAWAFEGGMFFLVSLAFGDMVLGLVAVLMTLAVANLATLVPSTPGYVGTFDAAAVVVLTQIFGYPKEAAFSYVIVVHAALYLPITVLGFVYWIREHLSFKEIGESRSQSSEDTAAPIAPLVDAPPPTREQVTTAR